MKITRITEDAAGLSTFTDVPIALEDQGTIGRLSQLVPAEGVIFRETSPDYDYDWHPAPQRQYIVLLDGEIEIEVGTGEIRRFRGGEVLLVEDTKGRGHRTRAIGDKPRRSLFIPLGQASA